MLRKKNDTVSIPVRDAETVSPDFEEDLSLLEHTLSLSYEERIQHHQSALDLFLELQGAGEKLRARTDEVGPR